MLKSSSIENVLGVREGGTTLAYSVFGSKDYGHPKL
jgi:hypothetical protein